MYSQLFDFQDRLDKVFEKMDKASLLIVDSNPEAIRTGDQNHSYRPNSYMIYLVGFEEPNSHLILTKDKPNKPGFLFLSPACILWNYIEV